MVEVSAVIRLGEKAKRDRSAAGGLVAAAVIAVFALAATLGFWAAIFWLAKHILFS